MTKKSLPYVLLIATTFVTSCKTAFYKPKTFSKRIENTATYSNSFHGICFYDMDKKQYLINHNDEKYFTPASNTKLFTLYAGMRLLEEQSNALFYTTLGDSLIFWGAADGTLLYPNVGNDSTAVSFLRKQNKQLFYAPNNYKDLILGDGWAWNDFPYYYSAERSALPIYGNLATINYDKSDKATIFPKYFAPFLKKDSTISDKVSRSVRGNDFFYKSASTSYTELVCFATSPSLTAQLLSDTLKKKITLINYPISKKLTINKLKGIAMDSIYKEMLYESDNYLAEQVLLACSTQLPESNFEINGEKTVEYMLKNELADLSQKPKWVDGSGLSRYNLMSPRSIVELLQKIYAEANKKANGEKRLFTLLPSPNKKGTLKNTASIYPPTLYAKTGTLSNNHCLSGYLVTKSGKKLCFSMMNNHYQTPTSSIRNEMGKILMDFYERY